MQNARPVAVYSKKKLFPLTINMESNMTEDIHSILQTVKKNYYSMVRAVTIYS